MSSAQTGSYDVTPSEFPSVLIVTSLKTCTSARHRNNVQCQVHVVAFSLVTQRAAARGNQDFGARNRVLLQDVVTRIYELSVRRRSGTSFEHGTSKQ